MVALREHVEGQGAEALAEFHVDTEAAKRLLVNRRVHAPSEVLRERMAAVPGEAEAMEALLRRLFRLEEGEERQSTPQIPLDLKLDRLCAATPSFSDALGNPALPGGEFATLRRNTAT